MEHRVRGLILTVDEINKLTVPGKARIFATIHFCELNATSSTQHLPPQAKDGNEKRLKEKKE